MKTNKQWKRVPFNIELAKKIQSGEVEGRIITNNGREVTILCFNKKSVSSAPLVALVHYSPSEDKVHTYTETGYVSSEDSRMYDLFIELLEETPKHEFKVGDKVQVNGSEMIFEIFKIDGEDVLLKDINNIMLGYYRYALNDLRLPIEKHEFKPFDKVLVRNNDCEAWSARLYDVWFPELDLHGTQDNKEWKQCIPYEGNEHLVGTTDKPKED